jgi:hypothetical protein
MRVALLGIVGIATSSPANNGRKAVHLKHVQVK